LTRVLAVLPLLAACQTTATPTVRTPAPDLGSRAVAENGMVSSAHPLASEAGVEMLRRGGNAVDAAVATAFALGVGEPQMSGVGGGGGMLLWLQNEGRAEYLDFYSAQRVESWRGLPPLAEGPLNLRVVGIPGEVAGLLEAHDRFGRLSRAEVLAPAIRMAEEGFPVNQILASMIASSAEKLERFPASRALLWKGDEPLQPGDILRNPELAGVLRRIAEQGRSGFYAGETAQQLVQALSDGGHPVTLADLLAYAPQWKRPLCTDYRGHVVLSAPPPQTGLQLVHTLNLLEQYDLRAIGYPTQSPEAFDVLASAIRVANTDNRVNSDPNWATVPAAGATSKMFARQRAVLVGTGRAMAEITAGPDPSRFDSVPPAPDCRPLDPYGPAPRAAAAPAPAPAPPAALPATVQVGGETTHLSVVDRDGNAVALSQTNSAVWGSGASLAGFFLNNSGIDLSKGVVHDRGRNAWRIRNSTIAPTILLRDGRVHMVIGAPGGGRIQSAILQTILYLVDYRLDALEAVRMPRLYPSRGETKVETENGFNPQTLAGAKAMGYTPTADASGYARVYVIARLGDRWVGVADPRHNGAARGY
jgi:gamma-glutamyltranspeptidase/glutathione hydrolase